MKRFWLLILLIILYPTTGVRAADGICACYYDEGYCKYSYDDGSGVTFSDASECATYCDDKFGDTVTDTDFAEDSDSEGGIDVGADCVESNEAAEAIATATDSSSTSTSTPTSRKLLTPVLSIDIPTVTFSDVLETVGEDGATYLSINYLGDYIAGVYKYLLGISTTIAIVMLMVSGLQWSLGGQSTEAVGKAQARIKNAVTGLVLLLSAYLILFTVNPNLIKLTFPKLKLIQEVPLDNLVESDADAAQCSSGNLTGVNDFQDCMLSTYGASKSQVELVTIKYKNRSYQVHKLMAEDFQKALDAIDASGVSYDITTDTAGGTYNWRCNKNNTKALSSHSWGTALDINPSTNPNCPSKCLDDDASTACSCVGGTSTVSCETMCEEKQYDLPQEVIDAFKSNNFKWGGDYKKIKDYMHFDYAKNCL